MSAIDLETNRLLDERSASVGGGAVAPQRTFSNDPDKKQPEWTAKRLPTNNPPAASLKYDVASEARDVAKRLEGYQQSEADPVPGQPPLKLALTDALRTGQKSANEYLAAEETYILAAIQLLTTRHLWSPRLFNDTTLGVAGRGTAGDYQHSLSIVNNLRVAKRLPFGGVVEASWLTQATDQLRDRVSDNYIQSSELVLSGTIPLLRGAGDVAQEDLIQAERNLVYQARNFEQFRRDFLIDIASDYFDLLQSRAEIKNQEEALANLKNIERGQQALLDAGRIAEFERNIAANDTLEATATLAGQKEAYILQLERFKIRLGLKSLEPVELSETLFDIPEAEVSLVKAVELALLYRLDLQNQRDQVIDSKRAVLNAKNQTLPDLNVTGRIGTITSPRRNVGRLSFSSDDLDYQAGVTLGLPLDRQAEKLGVRSATIALQAAEREYQKSRDEATVSVRQAVRNVDLARFQLTLAERQVEINTRRVRETELKRDEVTTQTRVDAANALQQSQNSRDSTKTNLRNAVLRYLRESGQLRVARDGTFQPLPGMEKEPGPNPSGGGE